MSGTLMVGVDGSAGGERALDFALAQAKAGGRSLLVAAVIPHSPHSFLTMNELTHNEQLRREHREKAEQAVLAPAVDKAKAAGVDARPLIAFGNPGEVLADLARENGVDALVVGRRGLSPVKALMFGSVAGNLVQLSTVPVIVVP
ncbi:MAG TPA: universal stress protein [Xanthomonadaceae bacterium]|nr:universal stress protein [Xanthomonadaceae bacterium]